MSDINAVVEKVHAQAELFEAELPELLKQHAGKYVVYLDGVRGLFGSFAEAYAFAVGKFGLHGGYVVAPVEERRPICIPSLWVVASGPRSSRSG